MHPPAPFRGCGMADCKIRSCMRDVLHAGLVPRRIFSDKRFHRRYRELPAMPPRAPGGSMGWTERCDTPWALTVPSGAAVALAARHLAPTTHRAAAASAPPERTRVPRCRRCRIGSSFATKWTRPVASDAACHAHTRRPSRFKTTLFVFTVVIPAQHARIARECEERHGIGRSDAASKCMLARTFRIGEPTSHLHLPVLVARAARSTVTVSTVPSRWSTCVSSGSR